MATAIRRRIPRTVARAGLGALALLAWSCGRAVPPLSAQASFDAGGVAVRYDGVTTLQGLQLAPRIRAVGTRFYVDLGGSAARFNDASWSAAGDGLLAWRPGEVAGLAPEVITFGGLAGAEASATSSRIGGIARLHRSLGPVDLYAGGGATRSDGVLSVRTLATGTLGASIGDEGSSGSMEFAPARGTGVAYTDVTLDLQHAGSVTLEMMAGLRSLTRPRREQHPWIGASGEVRLGDGVSVIASGGTFPGDPAQGFPGGRFLTVGLRLGRGAHPDLHSRGVSPVARPVPWPEAAFEVQDRGELEREFIVRAPTATSVEVAGDFSDWNPIPLVGEGGRWRVRLRLPPGIHHLNIRLDGGSWLVPPGLQAASDDFGTRSGLLVIE